MRGTDIDDPKFIEALKDVDAVLCGNNLQVNAAMLEMAPRLRAVAKMGVGLDTVYIKAASSHNAIVFNTPRANNQAVADHTFGLILSLARKIVFCDRSLREKRWEHTKIMGIEIWQKTIGLIGLGAIGRCVARRAKGFQMKVVAHDPFWPEQFADEHGIEKMEIDDLLKVSDIVSLHLPLTEENRGMINEKTFQSMKPTALLINAARGEIVKEIDLFNALKDNVIAGAGLDVFENEPPTNSPLLTLDNVVMTPHIAAFTHDTMNKMCTGIADQLIEYAKGHKPAHIVNPEVFDRMKA
jgi:D-3-phosphoglycerate dehydrogenase